MLTRPRNRSIAAPFVAILSLACDMAEPGSPAEPGSAAEEILPRDGGGLPLLNTWKLFGSPIDAVDTQGAALGDENVILLDVFVVDDADFPAIEPGSLTVDHGTLQAEIDGVFVSGSDFEDSLWRFSVDGEVMEAYLTKVETAEEADLYDPESAPEQLKLDPQRDLYTFKFREGVNLYDTCDNDTIAGARTVIYGDIDVADNGDISARPNTLYLGCISGAVGKAALWGYAPDSPSLTSIPLDAFETAVRQIRADYCGDGTSNTSVGNQVLVKDHWAINGFGLPGYSTEAVWQAGGGAVCVRRIRETGESLLAPFKCANNTTIPLCAGDLTLQNRWINGSYTFWSKIPL